MIYGSICSGIEAATVAWHQLDWKAAFFSEIEKFPRSVLTHHYPNVPLHGDFTTIGENDYGTIDLLVGGTPCQDFSVAGLRKGLAGERGNLTLEFIRLAERKKPRWLLWENVPGVLSQDNGRAFGSFLGGLAKCGYGVAYRVLDAQYFGVPQRRRRVFVIGYLGDWRPAAAVLFERESLQRDTTPSREAGENIAPTINARTKGGGGLGTDFDCDGGLITYGFNSNARPDEMNLLNTSILTASQLPSILMGKVELHSTLYASQGGVGGRADGLNKNTAHVVPDSNMKVRRLTPLECERLQGFPDGYTKITDKTADGPRYKALGNSMAVPCMHWLGERINLINTTILSNEWAERAVVGELNPHVWEAK